MHKITGIAPDMVEDMGNTALKIWRSAPYHHKGRSQGIDHKLQKGDCGVPVQQSPKCVLDCSHGPAGRDCHSLGSKWAFIHSQKEDPLRNLLVYGPGGQGNNMDLPILGVIQQYLGLLVLGLGLLHLSLGLLLLRLGLLLLKLGLWRRA
ncbi:hypothetical protein DSO57_1004222 [Entomophthora muscae]|uniref:Uncharacterized protein n=1 Tax=Entomophthora muscae TaxID=34485 RepID=A0ACC2RN47_9FUNG|nr:hypothetical protein DSO57_1004222 [Entomophthora muscae]